MPSSLLEFTWNRPNSAVRILEGELIGRPELDDAYITDLSHCWKLPSGSPSSLVFEVTAGPRSYSPSHTPEVLERFQSLSDVASYGEFAARYGLLGLDRVPLVEEPQTKRWLPAGNAHLAYGLFWEGSDTWNRATGESAASWEIAVYELATAISLWGELRGRDVPALERKLRPDDTYGLLFRDPYTNLSPSAQAAVATKTQAFFLNLWCGLRWSGANPLDFAEGGWDLLESFIASKVHLHFFFKGLPCQGDSSGGLRLRPKSLIDYLWLELAIRIAGGQPPRSCVRCNRWFLIDLRSRRRHDIYCSNRCRQSSYRQRRKKRA